MGLIPKRADVLFMLRAGYDHRREHPDDSEFAEVHERMVAHGKLMYRFTEDELSLDEYKYEEGKEYR